jgi:MFS family permease
MRVEIREGLVALLGHPVLRALVIMAALLLFAVSAQQAIFILYLVRDLELSPALIGAAFAVQSVGALAGAIVAARLARWLGIGPSFLAAAALLLAGAYLRASTGSDAAGLAIIAVGQLLVGVAASIFNVNMPSLRQALTPDHLLGRVNASYRFAAWGVTPLGALAGGLIAQSFGPRAAMLAAAAWLALTILWIAVTPLRSIRVVAPREARVAG